MSVGAAIVGMSVMGPAQAAPAPLGVREVAVPAAAAGLAAAKETTGTAGTLSTLRAAPDGTIFGADDRGIFRLTTDGWSLIRPIEKVTPVGAGRDPVSLQFSGWSGAMTLIPGAASSDYTLVAGDGAGGDIIRSTDGGTTWTTIKVMPNTLYDNGAVTGLCWSPTDGANTLYALIQKTQTDMNPAYMQSATRGSTWSFIPEGVWPESCDMGRGGVLSAQDPSNPDRVIVAGGTGLTLYDGDAEITEEVPACLDDPAGFARGALYGVRVVLVTEDGCVATSTYDPELQVFGEWTEKAMADVGSVGIFSQGYYETPTTMTMYGDTAWVASQAGIFAYSWTSGSWFNAGRGIPLRESVAVPTVRSGDRVIMGGYQGSITVLGLFASDNAGATFKRMTKVPASIEPRGLAITGSTIYLSDYDVMMESFDVWASTNAGASWSRTTGESVVGEPVVMAAIQDHLYVVVNTSGAWSIQQSEDAGATFTEVDSSACGWATGSGVPSAAIAPDGGVIILSTARTGTATLRGCTVSPGDDAAAAISTRVTTGAGVISLIDYLDGQMRAYLGPTGSTNATALVSDDGTSWTACATASALAKQPAYITSIARDADRALIGTVVNPLSGTRLIRSTDGGCTWTWPEEIPVDEEDVDMSSMVLPAEGEAEFADLQDSIEIVFGGLGRTARGLQPAARPAVTAAVRALRVIGPGSSGAVPVSVRFGTPPSAPKKGSATVGKGRVTLRFTAPTSAGGGLVGYSAACTARGKTTRRATAGAAATSIVVSSLAAKTSYTCTVVARDAAGPGPAATWTGVKPT